MKEHRTRRRERGQGLVEFAVIFPLFVVLIFMMVDGGLVMGRHNSITNGAKEGARLGAVMDGSPTSAKNAIRDRVEGQVHGLLGNDPPLDCATGAPPPAVCIQWIEGPDGQSPGQVGSSVRVKLKYEYDLITPLPNFASFDWIVTSCAVQRLERPLSDIPSGDDAVSDSTSGC